MQEFSLSDVWGIRAQVYAFLGNSLLKVMTEESAVVLDPGFWHDFPIEPANEHMERALADLAVFVGRLAPSVRPTAMHGVAAEYTRLFVGPGAPPAPLWESLYRDGGKFLFGQPTFDVKAVLREQSLQLDESAHQLEDHLGVELLFLAAMSERFVLQQPSADDVRQQRKFIEAHPLWWVGDLHQRAVNLVPQGYYAPFIELVWGVLLWDVELLEELEGQR